MCLERKQYTEQGAHPVPLGSTVNLQDIPLRSLTCNNPSAGSWQRFSSSEMRAASCVLCWPSLAAPSRSRGSTSSSSSSSFCSSCCSSSANRRRSLSNSPSTFCRWLSTIFCRAQEGQLTARPDAGTQTDHLGMPTPQIHPPRLIRHRIHCQELPRPQELTTYPICHPWLLRYIADNYGLFTSQTHPLSHQTSNLPPAATQTQVPFLRPVTPKSVTQAPSPSLHVSQTKLPPQR